MGDVILVDSSELMKMRENRAVNCETLLMLTSAAPLSVVLVFISKRKVELIGRSGCLHSESLTIYSPILSHFYKFTIVCYITQFFNKLV